MTENTNEQTANVAVQKKERSIFGHPPGLMLLFFTEMAERFSYYGMRPLFKLYLISALFENSTANSIYGAFTGLVYLTPMLGGLISDRYWGNRICIIVGAVLMAIGEFLLFFSAMFVNRAVYEMNGLVDPKVDNSLSKILFLSGVVFLIFGNGFFKPNISTMVGDLYEPSDERKDSAYTIFYMGINLGAFFAPFICGKLAPEEDGYLHPRDFKWGYFAAGVGMLLSLICFVLFKNKFIVTPEGLAIGLTPAKDQIKAKRIEENKLLEKSLKAEEAKPEEPKEVKDNKVALRVTISAVVGIVVGVTYYLFLSSMPAKPNVMNYVVEIINSLIWACFIALPLYIITDRTLNGNERARISVIYIIAGFAVFFWSAYEQAATSLTDIAAFASDRRIFGNVSIKVPYLQSVNPFFIVILAPLFAYMWEFLNKHGKEPSSVSKQGLGFIILALSYLFITIGYKDYNFEAGEKKSIWWLIILYFIQTLGELCLSPIGNSLVYKLAPPHLCSLLMGVWLMSSSISNVFAVKIANYAPSAAEKTPDGKVIYRHLFGIKMDTFFKFFNVFIVMNSVAGVVFFCLVPYLKRQMRGIN